MRVVLDYGGDGVELANGETIVGRGVMCRIRLNDPSVSRQHVRLRVADGRVVAEDLGSKNGTLLRGQPLGGPTTLAHGDVLQIGDVPVGIRILDGAPHAYQDDDDETFTTPNLIAGEVTTRIDREQLDRRREERFAVEVPVIYSSATLAFEAIARDLSRGGMFLACELLDPINTPCSLTVLCDGPTVSMTGVVAHVVVDSSRGRLPGMGIKFTSVGPDGERWVLQMLEQAARERAQ